MTIRTGWCWVILLSATEAPNFAQTLTNQSLSGKYFFRHVSLATDGASTTNLKDSRSLIGTITFDGKGGFSFTGQLLNGNSGAVPQSGSGGYSVDPGGFIALDNPLGASGKINARYSSEAVLGSTTEASDNSFDLFVAIPAP